MLYAISLLSLWNRFQPYSWTTSVTWWVFWQVIGKTLIEQKKIHKSFGGSSGCTVCSFALNHSLSTGKERFLLSLKWVVWVENRADGATAGALVVSCQKWGHCKQAEYAFEVFETCTDIDSWKADSKCYIAIWFRFGWGACGAIPKVRVMLSSMAIFNKPEGWCFDIEYEAKISHTRQTKQKNTYNKGLCFSFLGQHVSEQRLFRFYSTPQVAQWPVLASTISLYRGGWARGCWRVGF